MNYWSTPTVVASFPTLFQFYDAQESLSSSVQNDSATPLPSLSHLDSVSGVDDDILGHSAAAVTMGDIDAAMNAAGACADADAIRNSLDVFDQERAQLVNKALDRVSALLQSLDETEKLYASGKMFRIDHPVVGNLEFQSRVRCLCMWYNLTRSGYM